MSCFVVPIGYDRRFITDAVEVFTIKGKIDPIKELSCSILDCCLHLHFILIIQKLDIIQPQTCFLFSIEVTLPVKQLIFSKFYD